MCERVLHRCYSRGWHEAARPVEDVTERECVPDQEHRRLGTSEHAAQATREAGGRLGTALTSARSRHRWWLAGGPRSIIVQEPTVEASEVDLVELRHDDRRDVAACESDLQCFLRPPQLGGHTELDLRPRECILEPPRLLDSFGRELRPRDSARGEAVAIRSGQRMSSDDEGFQCRAPRSEQDGPVVEHVLHPDSFVEPDRCHVLGANEETDGRDTCEENSAEIAKSSSRVPLAPDRRIDPDLLQLDCGGGPRRRFRLEADQAVVFPEPGPALLDLCACAPAEAFRVALHGIHAELLLVSGRTGREKKLEIVERRRPQAGAAGLGQLADGENRLTRSILAGSRQMRPHFLPQLAHRL
jgi:hypothetical protein